MCWDSFIILLSRRKCSVEYSSLELTFPFFTKVMQAPHAAPSQHLIKYPYLPSEFTLIAFHLHLAGHPGVLKRTNSNSKRKIASLHAER